MLQQTQQERVRIDRIIFKPGLKRHQLKMQLGRARSLTDMTKWNLSDQNYTVYQIQSLLDIFQQIEIKQLYFNRVASSNILKLVQIRFPVLINLSLQGNNIFSVESLVHLNAINLKTLWLAYNHITRIKPLTKMLIPELEWLSLCINNNPILEFQVLSSLRAANLEYVEFGRPFVGAANEAAVTWLVKLQTNSLNTVSLLQDFKFNVIHQMVQERFRDPIYSH